MVAYAIMPDRPADGSAFRTANVLDDYNLEGLDIEVDLSRPSLRATPAISHIG